MSEEVKTTGLDAKLQAVLRNPLQLRMLVCGVGIVLWYLAVYIPLSESIQSNYDGLSRERRRLALANEIEDLRNHFATFSDRLPQHSDSNEFMQYLMAGLRDMPLKIISLTPDTGKEFGPYKIVIFKLDLEGNFEGIEQFLQWAESNERFLRIDAVRAEPRRDNPGKLILSAVVLGLTEPNSEDKTRPPGDKSKDQEATRRPGKVAAAQPLRPRISVDQAGTPTSSARPATEPVPPPKTRSPRREVST